MASTPRRTNAERISMKDAVRRAVRESVARGVHISRVDQAAYAVMTSHADAIRRLGE